MHFIQLEVEKIEFLPKGAHVYRQLKIMTGALGFRISKHGGGVLLANQCNTENYPIVLCLVGKKTTMALKIPVRGF